MMRLTSIAVLVLCGFFAQAFARNCHHYRRSECTPPQPHGWPVCTAPAVHLTCRDGDPYCDWDRQCNGECLLSVCQIETDRNCAPEVGFCFVPDEVPAERAEYANPNLFPFFGVNRDYAHPVKVGEHARQRAHLDWQAYAPTHLVPPGEQFIISTPYDMRCLPAKTGCNYIRTQ